MLQVSELLVGLQPDHVLEAIRRLDSGYQTDFSDSVKYDLVYKGRRYAPKRVAGAALELVTGIKYGPKSFKGGEESSCFRALRRCGFTVVEKALVPSRALTEDFQELLYLQTKYDSTNTPDMQRRGVLVRNAVPDQIRNRIATLEPIFTAAGYSLGIEGSDGLGRKSESAWVRIFDNLMSPSATAGWYVVLHFSRDGKHLFSTIGCGATTYRDGSLFHIPDSDLEERVAWARRVAIGLSFPADGFKDRVDLQGNKLSRQFEKATAYAKKYDIDQFSESNFWHDLEILTRLLIGFYECERLGKAPLSDQPEVISGQEDIDRAVSKRKGRSKGQGRGLSIAERMAVEQRAMEAAIPCLEAAGFTQITDVHGSESYDYTATRSGRQWPIEVKGTTSPAVDTFLLTANELRLHKEQQGQTALVLVCDIQLTRSAEGVTAAGGKVELLAPWSLDGWLFEASAYRAKRSDITT